MEPTNLDEPGYRADPARIAGDVGTLDQQSLMRMAGDGSAEARRRLLAVMRDLHGEHSVLTDRERTLVTDILKKLVRDFETEVRTRLAAILAEEPRRLPAGLLPMVREGEIDIARRLLLRSPLLKDEELIEIVHHRAQQHRLATGLQRPQPAVPEPEDAMEGLLEHADPAVAAAAVDYLVEEAKRLDMFKEPVLRREELARPLAERIAVLVAAGLRAHLLDRFATDPAVLDDALEAAVREHPVPARPLEPPTAAVRLARRLAENRLVGPDLLLRLLRQGEVVLFEAILAEHARIPAQRLRRILNEPKGRALAMLCRALGFPRGAFGSIYLLRTQHDDYRVQDPVAFGEAMAFFDGLPQKDAVDLLVLWRRDPTYVDAVEHLRSL